MKPILTLLTVLMPRKAGEPAPTFATALDGNGVCVTFADGRVDTLVLMAQPREGTVEGQKLAGHAFLVSRAPEGTVTVTALEAGTVK